MKIILKVFKILLNLIFVIFKLLPVKDKITFISRQANERTEDIQMLSEEIARQAHDVEVICLCRKIRGGLSGKISYCFHMLTQMYHIATSKVVILDSYCICISVLKQRKSLTVIQMWHALGSLKKFGLSIVGAGEGRDAGVADAMAMHKNYTWVLTSGDACLLNFAEAFGYGPESMKVMSLPRVDKLTDPELRDSMLNKVYEAYPEFKEKRVVVYAPTFRKDRDISEETEALASQFDQAEYAFVLKKHPLMDVNCSTAISDDKFTTLEMMFAADYVICDYSAVIYEAAIMKKPLFFYTFDYDSYGVERDFYIDYYQEMPGIKASDPSVLAAAIRTNNFDTDAVADFSYKYVKHQKNCTAELASFVLQCAAQK